MSSPTYGDSTYRLAYKLCSELSARTGENAPKTGDSFNQLLFKIALTLYGY